MSSVFNLEKLTAASSAPPLTVEPVPVYEFGAGTIAWIAELSANEREERIERIRLKHQDDESGFRAHVVAACWCNTQARDFVAKSEDEICAAAELLGKQGKAVIRMFEMADKLNAISPKEIERVEKNSPSAGGGSGT